MAAKKYKTGEDGEIRDATDEEVANLLQIVKDNPPREASE